MKKREMMSMQAVLYALAMKVLNEDEMKRIEEMMTMTLLGQMLMEDGMKKGMEKGEFKNMQELDRDGVLTVEAAAARKNLTVKEYRRKIRALKLD